MVVLCVIIQLLPHWESEWVVAGGPRDLFIQGGHQSMKSESTGLEASALRAGRHLGPQIREPEGLLWVH